MTLSKNYRGLLLKKINLIKKITLAIIGLCTVFMMAGTCLMVYYTYTHSWKIDISTCCLLFGLFFFYDHGFLHDLFF